MSSPTSHERLWTGNKVDCFPYMIATIGKTQKMQAHFDYTQPVPAGV